MRLKARTSLGIDVCDGLIHLALLKKGKDSVELVKAVSGPLPEGTVANGNVEDAAKLAKAIKDLKTRHRIRADAVAISVFIKPALSEILDVSTSGPMNVGQLVNDEVRNCIGLSGRKAVSDYCRIGTKDKTGKEIRLFVAATDGQKLAEINRACRKVGLNLKSIEPPVLALARALYDGKIAHEEYDANVLLAMLRDGELTLCVFRKQGLDYVRTRDVGDDALDADILCQRIAKEVNSIIKFYAVDVPDSSGNWRITVVADGTLESMEDAEESLRAATANDDLIVMTGKDALENTPVTPARRVGKETKLSPPSPVSIGLAIKLLGVSQSNLGVNLKCSESSEVRALKKDTLIAANAFAAVLALSIVAVAGLTVSIGKATDRAGSLRKNQPAASLTAMAKEMDSNTEMIRELREGPELLKESIGARHDIYWSELLRDIGSSTPKHLRITNLSSNGGAQILLEGVARSYEAVDMFTRILNKSEHIEAASLRETARDEGDQLLITYMIECSLIPIRNPVNDDR